MAALIAQRDELVVRQDFADVEGLHRAAGVGHPAIVGLPAAFHWSTA